MVVLGQAERAEAPLITFQAGEELIEQPLPSATVDLGRARHHAIQIEHCGVDRRPEGRGQLRLLEIAHGAYDHRDAAAAGSICSALIWR
jgi:hypothetical protein